MFTKKSEIFDIDLKEMRKSIREQLSERSTYIAERLEIVISENLTEAYTDTPQAKNPKTVNYTREDVRKMLSTWETPNSDSNNFDNNMDNEYNKSKEGEAKLKDGTDNVKDITSDHDALDAVDVQDPEEARKNTIRFMKELYFTESENDNTFYIDSDDDDLDDETFRAALQKAKDENESVELSLDDDNTIDLNSDIIAKILDDKDLFKKVLGGLDSIDTITKILDLSLQDDDITESEEAESDNVADEDDEENVAPQSPEGNNLKESILDYMDNLIPEALYTINEATFNRTPQDISKLVAQMQKSGNRPSEQKNSKNRISRGRMAMVNRVRAGKLQMRKLISDSKGYKVVDGSAVRMKPSEIKNRRISARFASKKRRNMQASINRKTKISIRYRNRRLA